MKIDDEIKETRKRLTILEAERRQSTPKLQDFYKLIRVRFSDCLNALPLRRMGMSNGNNPTDTDDDNDARWPLATTLLVLYSFYAGRIYEDADQTGLYKGPAIHRIRTLFVDYINHLYVLDSFVNPFDKYCEPASEIVRGAYSDLNNIGKYK